MTDAILSLLVLAGAVVVAFLSGVLAGVLVDDEKRGSGLWVASGVLLLAAFVAVVAWLVVTL